MDAAHQQAAQDTAPQHAPPLHQPQHNDTDEYSSDDDDFDDLANEAKASSKAPQRKDKSDRATVEQAIDPRTRRILFRLLNAGTFDAIHGCVSTGKEANVYHATAGEAHLRLLEGDASGSAYSTDLAVKVYKTSILVFKDRDRYVRGDVRFSSKYSKGNPRKMVATWAEKEMRNLHRLAAAGVPCPRARARRKHVLVMDFVGTNGIAAPRLKDAQLGHDELRAAYRELLRLMWVLWARARLVHADLSEYNILVHKGELVIIDVSQSVDLDHPLALDFLREDCTHVNDFFRRAGVATLTMRQAFEFVIDPAVTAANVDSVLDKLSEMAASRPVEPSAADRLDDAIFGGAYIPRKLEEVVHYERDHQRVADAGTDAQTLSDAHHFQMLSGMKLDMSGPRDAPLVLERLGLGPSGAEEPPSSPRDHTSAHDGDGEGDSDDDDDDDSDDSDASEGDSEGSSEEEGEGGGTDEASGGLSTSEGGGVGGRRGRVVVDPEAVKAERKAHKKAVKEANRERRRHKLPKHLKKQANKRSAHRAKSTS